MEIVETPKPDIGWAIVELMGHRRLGGYVSEETRFGVALCRIDIPATGADFAATQYYGASAIYSITPTTEEIATAVARLNRPTPVYRYELALPVPKSVEGGAYRQTDSDREIDAPEDGSGE